jgi:hypothetical protein
MGFGFPFPVWAQGGKNAVERYTVWKPITTSDATNLTGGVTHAVWVGGAGNIAAVAQDNTVQNFLAVPAGTWLPIGAKRINATNTTATNMLALYQV